METRQRQEQFGGETSGGGKLCAGPSGAMTSNETDLRRFRGAESV